MLEQDSCCHLLAQRQSLLHQICSSADENNLLMRNADTCSTQDRPQPGSFLLSLCQQEASRTTALELSTCSFSQSRPAARFPCSVCVESQLQHAVIHSPAVTFTPLRSPCTALSLLVPCLTARLISFLSVYSQLHVPGVSNTLPLCLCGLLPPELTPAACQSPIPVV